MYLQCMFIRWYPLSIKVTPDTPVIMKSALTSVPGRRISKSDLEAVLERNNTNHAGVPTLCYICGPSSMIDTVENHLLELGVKPDNIQYEKWW